MQYNQNPYGQNPYTGQTRNPYGGQMNGTVSPRQPLPSYPGVGQTGNPYGRQISSPYGGGGRAPQPFPSTPFPGLGQMNPMLNNPGGITGWQTQTQPMGAPQGMSSRGDPTAQEQMRRRQLMLQQQLMQLNQQGIGQGGQYAQAQPMQYNPIPSQPMQYNPIPMTQQFPVQNAWQQRVPQNFNQGAAYGPFMRAW